MAVGWSWNLIRRIKSELFLSSQLLFHRNRRLQRCITADLSVYLTLHLTFICEKAPEILELLHSIAFKGSRDYAKYE